MTHATCSLCGTVHDPSRTDPHCKFGRLMGAKKLCFSCAYWSERVNEADHHRSVRVDGQHYWFEDDQEGGFRGFGGAKFTIQFNDGRTVVTRNLWMQGPIPERFQAQLPNNAIFVE